MATSTSFRAMVLYACTGSLGHRVLAENYAEFLRSVGVDAMAVDVLQLDNRSTFRRYSKLYFWVLRFVPRAWRWLYRHWRKVPGIDFVRKDVLPRRFKVTRQLLCSIKPDLVISTHPVSTGIVSHLKKKGRIASPLWTTFSDWHVQPFWMFPEVTRYLVPLAQQRTALELLGVHPDKITVVGMLLGQDYYGHSPSRVNSVSTTKRSKVIVVISGGKGWGLESVIRELRGISAKIFVITGNSDRKQQVEAFLEAEGYGNHWLILGFVDPLPYLTEADLVITKPGGLSTAEILHFGKPLILVSAMPGHEDENALVLSRHGIPWIRTLEDLAPLVASCLMFGMPAFEFFSDPTQRHSPSLVLELLQSDIPTLCPSA